MNRLNDSLWRGALLVALCFASFAACDKEKAPAGETTAKTTAEAKPAGPVAEPMIPEPSGKFGPTFAKIPEGAHYDVDVHGDIETCTECHGEIVGQWKVSAHGLSSLNNPFYKTSFDDFVEQAGRDKAPFCAGCHDPTLLFDGAIERPIEPTEARAHLGITCNTCHGIEQATVDGNASYLLSTTFVPLPEDDKPETLAAHVKRVGGAKIRTNELCVSCHRGFLSPDTGHPVVVGGIDDFTPFHRSPYNGVQVGRISGLEKQTCVDCHMPEVEIGDGKTIRSHRFPGGHTTLAAAIGDEAQLAATTKMVQEGGAMDIAGWGVGKFGLEKPTKLAPGDQLWADVVVFNEKVGHLFPGGAGDLRDTWVEFVLEDANGNVLASAGTDHAETGEDESAHRLHALVGDVEGVNVNNHEVLSFRTPVYDHRIPPRGAQVVRYGWTVPDGEIAHPVSLKAKLRHRRLAKSLHDETCKRSKTELGKRWRAETKLRTGLDVDPCVEQPIVEIATAKAQIGGTERSPELPAWQRHYRWGIGLQEHVSESVDEAKVVFEKALETVDKSDKRKVAMIELVLGQVATRQGRRQDALDHFMRAEKLIGKHPAIDFARGKAHQRTFHNEEAAQAYKAASEQVHDDRIWRELAISSGSVFHHRDAYEAAQRGLEIAPRDPHLLRSQSLAAAKLDLPEESAEAAREAFLAFRRDELAPEIRVRCSKASPTCERERVPVHVHPLK